MSSSKKNLTLAVAVAAAVAAPSVFATNGMNMQGYGPIAYGMGGASMAYDNGTAATMNNPATLGLMGAGNRLDVALGVLMPDVSAETAGMPKATSGGDQYLMPAVGYAHKEGALTYGFGIFAQGGMGTEYAADTFLAMGSGQDVRSELGVGRLIFPIAYNVDSNLTVGGSIDYVWATLDLKMAMTGTQMAGLVTGCSGTACAGLPALGGAPWVRVDFSGGGDFSGAARGTGFAGKLGVTYKVNPDVAVGATYHSKTSLSDLETDSTGAALSAGGMGALGTGKIKVRDFEWPATYAIGVAWNASKELMVAADIKRIEWKDVMKDFKMTYDGAVGAGTAVMDFALPQNWENQTVTQIGVAYKMSDPVTLRAGINHASSQIPDQYVNPLFPAIMETHYTLGLGYAFDKASAFNAGIAVAPQVTATDANGVTSKSGGTSFQLMYTSQF